MTDSALQPVLTSCSEVAVQLLSQPDFFARHREDYPRIERPLPSMRYTGRRSSAEALNLRVGAMRLLGFSDRAIERECGVDRRTIPHRLAWLERGGRIPALKDRLQRIVGECAEKSGLVLITLLDRVAGGERSLELSAMIRSLAPSLGVSVEKHLLLTGQATEIVETRVAAGRDEFETWWRDQVKPIEATVTRSTPAVDSASYEQDPIPEGIRKISSPGHGHDTSVPTTNPVELVGAPAMTEPVGNGGGGGLGQPGAVKHPIH